MIAYPVLALTNVTRSATTPLAPFSAEDVISTGDEPGWNDTIKHANTVKNGVQVRYTSPARTALEIENNDFSAVYGLTNGSKYVSEFRNKNGEAYFTNSQDAYISCSGERFFASSSDERTYFNAFRLGYYYYDVHILGQAISNQDTSVNTSDAYNMFGFRRSWSGNMVEDVSYRNGKLSYVVTDTTDPYCYTQNISFSTSSYNAIQIEIETETANKCAIYFYTSNTGSFNAEQYVMFDITPGQKNTYTIGIDHLPNYTGNVNGIRVDCGTSVGETITITSFKAVYAEDLTSPVLFERIFHTYSDKLHEELRFIAQQSVPDLDSVGVQTKIPTSSVTQCLLSDGENSYTSPIDTPLIAAAFDTPAGVIGYVVPTGENMGSISVEIVDGYYVINRYVPVASLAEGEEISLATRIYNDTTHSFEGFSSEAYIERNPLSSANIYVAPSNDNPHYNGYDPFTGAYVFEVDGTGFNQSYYAQPDKHYTIPIQIKGDSIDRRIYIKSYTVHGSLECGAVVDEGGNLLPIPVEVCKNFRGEIEEPVYYPEDASYGEIYFPITLTSNEEKAFTVVNLYQNWGKYALKQLSSIQFFVSYYHLSTGVTETNCIAPYFVNGKDGWTLPDFRALSAPIWSDQPQHYSGGQIYFLKYTDAYGNSNKSETQSAQIHSAGPIYADIDMDYISDDGKIKAEYKHVELPNTDETRTNYQIKLTVLQDVTFNDFKNDFSFVSFDGRHVFYTALSYLDESGSIRNKSLSYNTSTVDYITLGKDAPFFAYYLRSGTSDAVVNMALMVKNSDITLNGEKYDGNFVLKNTYFNNMNYGALTLDLGNVTLKKGDELIVNTVLLPWGAPDDTEITSVLNVREDSCLDPYKLTVAKGQDISDTFVPKVMAQDGIAEFTLSGGDNMATVRVYGFSDYKISGIYELVDGEYVKYDTSTHGYDGYQVYYDEDGTYSFAYIIDMSSAAQRTFKVIYNIYGDINLDGKINGKDLIRLKKIVSKGSYLDYADVNGDGVVDGGDITSYVEEFLI